MKLLKDITWDLAVRWLDSALERRQRPTVTVGQRWRQAATKQGAVQPLHSKRDDHLIFFNSKLIAVPLHPDRV